MLTVGYILIFAGLIGGRLGFVLMHLGDYISDPLSAINPLQGGKLGISGLNLYGGIILALVAVLLYLRRKKLPVWAVCDLFAPTLGIGLAFGRIGCFLNGCCFGTPTTLPWGITFPPGSIPDSILGQQALHPAQLYSSAYGITLYFLLHRILQRKRFDGHVMAVLLMAEAVFRYFIEYVRYYEGEMRLPRFLGMEPTYNQVIAILLFAAGLVIYFKAPRFLHRTSAPAKG
jgi:phosphatidylglycerol:prolipoprotein diacylglycerol transferase